MPPRRKSTPKGRQSGNPPARGPGPRRKRLNGRKIVALGVLIILPLVVIAGVLGSIGSSSSNTPRTGGNSSAPGIDLITQACIQLKTLAQNTGAPAGTSSTTTGAGSSTTTVARSSTTTGAGATTTTENTAAAATNLLAQMQQVAQLAANAAGTNSAWQPMATDISKLNDMIQTNSGDNATFTSQLDTVAQECSAVVGSGSSTPATG